MQKTERMTTIYFVRHAQTDYSNPVDRERVLTPEGLRDRGKVRDFLLAQELDLEHLHIYSSSFRRAVDTVLPFAEAVGLPVQVCEEFREWTLIAPEEEYFTASEKAWQDFRYRVGQCETLEEVQQRNLGKIQELLKQHPQETIVIGSHGTALSTVIHYFDPFFGYQEFLRILDIKPWIVRFDFQKTEFCAYKEVFWNQS